MRTLGVTLLVVLSAASGCGPSATTDSPPRAVFVRGGFVLPGECTPDLVLSVTVDNVIHRLTPALPVGGRPFFRFPWRPGGRYELSLTSSEGVVRARRETLVAPTRPEPFVVTARELEKVHAGSVTAGGEPDASLAFSADGSLLAVGTFGGYLRVFDTSSGRCVLEKHFPLVQVKRVAISPDNSRVYVGEMSVDAFVSAFELKSQKPLWRFRLADELETSKPARPDDFFALYSYPQVYCMRVAGDDLVVDGFHSWSDAGRARHLSRIYRFDGRTGTPRWAWPADGPLHRNITWFDMDDRVVALSAQQWEKASDGLPQAAVCLLEAASGRLLDRHAFEPLKPHFTTTPMWYALALDDAGHLVLGLMDGRGVIFDVSQMTLRVVRELDLATPVEVTGVPIYAGAGWAAGDGGVVYLLTDGRLVAPSAGAQGKSVRADHPASNTLFAFSGAEGVLLWRWKLTTTAQGIAAGARVLAAATQQSYSADDPMDYGLTVFDTSLPGAPVEKLLFRYHTAGPIVAVEVSPDGRTVAAVEAPVRLPDDVTVVGKYRLHILR